MLGFILGFNVHWCATEVRCGSFYFESGLYLKRMFLFQVLILVLDKVRRHRTRHAKIKVKKQNVPTQYEMF